MSISEEKSPIKDTHYLVKWDVKDLSKINKWQERIRAGIDSSKDFIDLFEKSLNDHRNLKVDPIKVAVDRKYMLTWAGIAKMCRLVTKQDTTTFTHVHVGTGSTIPQVFDTGLVTWVASVAFSLNGFFDGAGVALRYAGTFGESLVNNLFKESMVSTQSTAGGTVLCRNIFANNPIDHDQGEAGFTAAGIIEFIPVA